MRLPLPLRIRKTPGGYVIEDAAEVLVAYVYAEADPTRRSIVRQRTPEDAEALAKRIARLLTDDEEGKAR